MIIINAHYLGENIPEKIKKIRKIRYPEDIVDKIKRCIDCGRRITLQTAYFHFDRCWKCFRRAKKCTICKKDINFKTSRDLDNMCHECYNEKNSKLKGAEEIKCLKS